MHIIYRKSINNDYKELKELFESCFGKMAENGGALSWIENRYMVCEIDEKIISCTGILPLNKSDYNGYEITWTCTYPDFRHKGYIIDMLSLCEDELKDNIPIYCDCWHFENKEFANLHNALSSIGFKKVIDKRIIRGYPHSLECKGCPYKKENCICFGDLYMKKR